MVKAAEVGPASNMPELPLALVSCTGHLRGSSAYTPTGPTPDMAEELVSHCGELLSCLITSCFLLTS